VLSELDSEIPLRVGDSLQGGTAADQDPVGSYCPAHDGLEVQRMSREARIHAVVPRRQAKYESEFTLLYAGALYNLRDLDVAIAVNIKKCGTEDAGCAIKSRRPAPTKTRAGIS
jgi:hypothetical protein